MGSFTTTRITRHLDLTEKEIAGVIDHANESITMEKLNKIIKVFILGLW